MADRVSERQVNSLRLRTFLDLLSKRAGAELEAALGELPSDLQRVLSYRETRTWLDTAAEALAVRSVASRLSAWELVEATGAEVVRGPLEQLLNRVAHGGRVENYVSWLPALFGLFRTGVTVAFERGVDGRSFRLVLSGREGEDLTAVDALFALGMTGAVLEYVQLKSEDARITTVCDAESDWPAGAPRPEKFSQSAIEIFGRTGELSRLVSEVRRSTPGLSWSTSPRDAFVKQVIARSSQLFQDKRELSTAVEYLNMANEELEKEIRANKKELRMAANIQKGFIPALIPDWEGFQFWVHFAPMQEVSGDLFDYLQLDGDRLGVLVADVSGHGVPAALISAIAKISFHAHRGRVPSEIFSQVNMELLNHVKMEGYLTAFFLVMQADLRGVYSMAGFPPPMLLRAATGTVEQLRGTGTLLGMFQDAGDLFLDFPVRFEPGDKLFVYTDGLLEATNPSEEQFGAERIEAAIAATRGMDIRASCESIIAAYREFTLGTETHDDLTLLGIMAGERTADQHRLLEQAHAAFASGGVAEAVRAAAEAYDLFPRSPRVLYAYAKYLAKSGAYNEALAKLREYSQFKPYDPNAHTIHAYCLARLGHPEQAERKLKQSLNLRGENPSALLNLVRIYLKQGRREEARETLGLFERLRPGSAEAAKLRRALDS